MQRGGSGKVPVTEDDVWMEICWGRQNSDYYVLTQIIIGKEEDKKRPMEPSILLQLLYG